MRFAQLKLELDEHNYSLISLATLWWLLVYLYAPKSLDVNHIYYSLLLSIDNYCSAVLYQGSRPTDCLSFLISV